MIGEAPRENYGNEFALYPRPTGCAGHHLQRLCGISASQYLRIFERTNVLDAHPGKGKGGDLFPPEEARRAALKKAPEFVNALVIFAGRRVADAFKWPDGYFEVKPHGVGLVTLMGAVIPHPSRRNRLWNDREMVNKASSFLRPIVEQACAGKNEQPLWLS